MIFSNEIFLSVVVPIYNEADNLEPLHREIRKALDPVSRENGWRYEILFINDGSDDQSDRICRGLSPLRYFRMERHQGQTAALNLGFHRAEGRYIAAMDADGQNDPRDIPALLEYLEEHELDAVCGWRKERHDALYRIILSKLAYLSRQLFLQDGIRDSGCTLKLFRRECFEELNLVRQQHRFIPALLKARGFRVGECEVHHRRRRSGESKYHLGRIREGIRELVRLRFSRSKTGEGREVQETAQEAEEIRL